MSCVAIHHKLDDFHCPRIVLSHITPYHRHRLVRRYAPQHDAVVGDQNLAARVLSLFIDVSGHQPTLFLLVCKRRNSRLLPLKIDFEMTSSSPGQLDSRKVRFSVHKAIFPFIV